MAAVEALSLRGFAPWTLDLTDAERAALEQFLARDCSNKPGAVFNSGRAGYGFSAWRLPVRLRRKIFTRELRDVLLAYLGSEPLVCRAEIIAVAGGALQQIMHRDQKSGPCLAATFGFCVRPDWGRWCCQAAT